MDVIHAVADKDFGISTSVLSRVMTRPLFSQYLQGDCVGASIGSYRSGLLVITT